MTDPERDLIEAEVAAALAPMVAEAAACGYCDGSCGDCQEVAQSMAGALAPLLAAERARAWDEGVTAVQAEAEPWCSRSFACTRTPANPYREREATT